MKTNQLFSSSARHRFLLLMLLTIFTCVNAWGTTYTKITSTSGLPSDGNSAKYLIVYESLNYVYDGSKTGSDLGASGDYKTAGNSTFTRSGSTITIKGTDNFYFTISRSGNNYIIQSASGYYIGRTTNSNGINQSTTDTYSHTITFSSNNAQITSSAGPKLQFLNSSGSYTFKYYKSSQQLVQLYKVDASCEDLSTPGSLSSATVTSNSVSPSWGSVSHASKYEVVLMNSSGTALTPTSTYTIETTSTSYTFSGLEASTTYKWKVKAVGDGTDYCDSEYTSNQTISTSASTTPTLTLTGSGAFGTVNVDGTKDLNFTLNGSNLSANASVSVTGSGFTLVTPAGGTLTQTAGSISGSNNITVRFSPTAATSYAGTLTVTSTGASDATVSLSGTGQLSDTYVDLMHDNSDITKTGSYSAPSMSTDDTGSDCKGTHKYFAGWSTSAGSTTVSVKAGDAVIADGSTYYAVWGDGEPTITYTRLTSIAGIDESAQYVLGIDGTGFHYSGTSSWGLMALPASQTPLYYTLTKESGVSPTYFTASTTVSDDTYYLEVGSTGAFNMTTSTGTDNGQLSIGSTTNFGGDDKAYAVSNKNSKDKSLRRNGASGIRCYNNTTTGNLVFFYKVTAGGAIDYKVSCCADAAEVTLTPSSQTVYRDIDGNAAATIAFSKTGGGSGAWGTPTVDPSGPTVTKDGSNINFSATATGTYTVGIGFTETCEKTGSATVTVAEQGIISASGTTTFSPSCGTNSASSDITVNSRYLAGSTITASIATSTGSGNFTISTDNSTFNTSNKSISGGTSAKVTSHIYVRYEPTVDETGSIAGRLTLTQGGTTTYVDLTGTVTCGCNIRFTSAANLVQITAANGIWVQANSELALSGSYLKTNADNANVSIRAYTNNAHFQIKTSGTSGEGTAKTSSASALSLATNEGSNTANGWTGSIGIVYKPAAHNTTETATLTVEVYRYGGSTVYSTATYTLYGRSLPENFVIAVNDGTLAAGHWYAVPADMIAPWGGSCTGLGTYTPYPITVDNNSVPTTATSAPSRAIYTAAARTGAVNTNPQTMSYKSVPLAGSGNYYLFGSSGSATTIQNASNASSEQQKWFLDVVNWANKEYNMHLHTDLNTRVLAYTTAGGANNVGEYAANVATTKKSIYILPVSATCTYYAAPVVTCYAIDATNYTVRFDCDRTSDYEISTNSGSTWSDLSVTEAEVCTEVPKKLQAVLPWATYRGQTIQIRAKSAGGCQAIGSFTVPNPNVAVNAGTWMTMSGIAGYAFNNTANSVAISGKASCGDQTVGVTCDNSKISASVNQSTGAVTISMTAGNATAGTHTAQLTFTLTGGTTRTQNISITLTAKATQTWDGGDVSHFWNGMLCDEEGILVNPTVYLSYDMYYNGSRISTIGDFNSYSTIYLKDLNTGTNVTAHSITRLKASDGVYGVDLINLTSNKDLTVGHKYRLVWENHSENNSIQDAVTNSSGVPYNDCHMDFVYTQDCSSPTLLPGCASGTTADVSWGNTSASCSNYTLEWFERTESSLTNTSIKDNTSNLIIWAYGASCYEANNNYLDDWIVSNSSTDYKSATYGYQVGGSTVKNYIFTPRLNQLYASAGTSTVYEVTVTLQNTGTANAYAAQCYAVDNTSSSTSVITSGYSATYNGVSTTYFVTPACPISSTITSTFKVTGLTATSRIGFTCQTKGNKLFVKNVAIKRLVDGDHSSATIAKSEDSYTITGLTTGKTYYATLTCGSSTSNEITFTTASGAPSVAFYSDAGFTSAITEADVVPGTPKTVYVRGTNVYFCGEEIPVTINSCFNIDSKSLEYNSETHVLEGNITVSNICAAADGPLTVSISGDHELLLHCTGDHQIEVVQWATNGLKIESYVIVSGTPSSGALNVTTSGGTYDLSHASLDITAHANEYLKITWNGRVENFRVPVFINSSCNSSTLSNVTEESVIVVNANKTLTINSDLVCAGIEIYPTAKVQFSSGSLTADYIRLYNNGDTWANFAKLDVTGASTISVDNVYADFRINEDRYHYIVLPFDIETDDVTYAAPIPNGGTPALRDATNNRAFYVRQYDGRARETNDKATETTYNVNMPHIGAKGGNYAMTAGRGYMIAIGDQVSATGHAKRTLRFPIAMTSSYWTAEKASSKVVGGAWVADGSDNGSARATNKGWNLVGNPFMRELTVTSTSGGMSTGYLDETGGTPMWQITDDGVRYITIYNAATDAFTYQPLNVSFTLKPMAAFYLQMKSAKYINFQAGMVGQAAAMPGLMRFDSQVEEEVNVIISLSNADQADKAGIVLHSKYDVAYNEADDADYPKLMSGTQVALWSVAGEEPLASNGLPKAATENIPLGFQAPQTGQYTFALDVDGCDMKWLKHVWLTDLEKNISRDLLLETYEFEEAQTEKREDRFLLGVELFSKEEIAEGTEIIDANNERPQKFIWQDKMYILRGGVIYDATGKRVGEINK